MLLNVILPISEVSRSGFTSINYGQRDLQIHHQMKIVSVKR